MYERNKKTKWIKVIIALKEITKILKLILHLTGNLCKERKTGVI